MAGLNIVITQKYVFLITLWLFNIAMENGTFIDDFPAINLHL